MNTIISRKQYEVLHGLFVHCWSVYHQGYEQDFKFYADRCDAEGIPWHVQNTVSCISEVRSNGFLYLRDMLKNNGVEII